MREIKEILNNKIKELLDNGTADRVIGWQEGEFCYDMTPALFNRKNADELRYNGFCGANQSKYLIQESQKEGKVLTLLKPCDTYSFNQLLKEHRINRENIYALGIPCTGMVDVEKMKNLGITGILGISEEKDIIKVDTLYGEKECKRNDVLLERCKACKGKEHKAYDELLIPLEEAPEVPGEDNRFGLVQKLESMSEEERFEFWRGELSKCIRCNACRNVCPACSCRTCVFDNVDSGVAAKANVDTFEENMFHIIRAFHVAGRCTDCGECSRVCPQQIPLHLLNRKFIKDIDEFYGEFQAGEDSDTVGPLTVYTQEDCEPGIVMEKGGGV